MMGNNELENRISQLEKENALLLQWQSEVNALCGRLMQMIGNHDKKLEEFELDSLQLKYDMITYKAALDSLPYEINDPELSLSFFRPRIYDGFETLRLLVEEHKSIARFGDCEFELLFGRQRWGYQQVDEKLSRRLREVVKSEDDRLLVGINPDFYKNHIGETGDEANGIHAYMTPTVRREHEQLLGSQRQYADALVFRNIAKYGGFDSLSKLWAGRDCLFVEGKNTGLGVGNDLFKDCASIERVICPAENSFEKYDEIMEKVGKHAHNKLVIAVLGPTASVLAYDLVKEGCQCVDLGQLDLVYEAYLRNMNDILDLVLPNKYCTVDVVGEKRVIQDIEDFSYKDQIVETIL